MSKVHSRYICQSCGHESLRWVGKCPNCNEYNTLVEEVVVPKRHQGRSGHKQDTQAPVPFTDVSTASDPRLETGFREFDRVLGGGIVPGSVVLVGGDPGIGKSTLLMQIAASMKDIVVLYVTGEESVQQIKMRGDRLEPKASRNLLLLAETNTDIIAAILEKRAPDMMIVDSIQTMYMHELESFPGTVSQVREATAMFSRFAKSHNVPVFLIGHVTKEGVIAGPKVLEHMVDTVLQFEGDRHYAYRILRASKNRFGSTNEIGIFEMQDSGLREVLNPSEVFLAERKPGSTGSAVVASMEGSRPLLLEVQALVARTNYGIPQRTPTGFDLQRLQMLLAVLEKRAGTEVSQCDVFVNVAGGVRVYEPAADLGIVLAIVSSRRDVPIDPRCVAVGEIGLGGEIRSVSLVDRRIAEARKLGFTKMIIPRAPRSPAANDGMEIIQVETLAQAMRYLGLQGEE